MELLSCFECSYVRFRVQMVSFFLIIQMVTFYLLSYCNEDLLVSLYSVFSCLASVSVFKLKYKSK